MYVRTHQQRSFPCTTVQYIYCIMMQVLKVVRLIILSSTRVTGIGSSVEQTNKPSKMLWVQRYWRRCCWLSCQLVSPTSQRHVCFGGVFRNNDIDHQRRYGYPVKRNNGILFAPWVTPNNSMPHHVRLLRHDRTPLGYLDSRSRQGCSHSEYGWCACRP